MVSAVNPILEGFYPDPSICRVGQEYYLVTSSFAYFPGVPIFHSRDLAHWQQIGHVLDRPSQLVLDGCGHSEGIFAPTIRYYQGMYYMITTNISAGGNFIVTAKAPEGPWSEPYYLEAEGIDPSLFFDEDGTCYYTGTRPNPEGVRYNGDWEIWCQVLDLEQMKLVGESHSLWKGALRDAIWPEGPHLYKKDGVYYLMIAEGGTGPDHGITVARSQTVFGPYTGNSKNPLITHRHLGKNFPVQNVGHGDLVEAPDGNWYMVLLATRPCQGFTSMGRETFLAKVSWEDGWPVVNEGVGRLEETVIYPGKAEAADPLPAVYSFCGNALPPEFVSLRAPAEQFCSMTKSMLCLYLRPETMKEEAVPAYVGVRQHHLNYQAAAWMEFVPGEGEEAGLCIVQSNDYHLRFVKAKRKNMVVLQVILCENGQDQVLAAWQAPDGPGTLRIIAREHRAKFWYEGNGQRLLIAEDVDIHNLSTETAGGFVGCTIGMYASSNGQETRNCCGFRWFSCHGLSVNGR